MFFTVTVTGFLIACLVLSVFYAKIQEKEVTL